jgi:ABC-2 type transport system permease protein
MLARLWFHLRMYATFQLVHLRTALAYEADFWIGIVGVALTHGVGLVFVWALFLRVPQIDGWGVWEVAFLYALSIIPRGLTELLCDGQWRLRHLINRGEFDRLLVRPISPALQVITQLSSIHGIGSVALGGVVLGRALAELGLAWGAGAWLLLAAALLSGTVTMSALNYATNCQGFWDSGSNSSFPFLMQNMAEFAKFPLTLYDRFVQLLLTWVVPFACASYYPGLVLLGRPVAQRGWPAWPRSPPPGWSPSRRSCGARAWRATRAPAISALPGPPFSKVVKESSISGCMLR